MEKVWQLPSTLSVTEQPGAGRPQVWEAGVSWYSRQVAVLPSLAGERMLLLQVVPCVPGEHWSLVEVQLTQPVLQSREVHTLLFV
jgi:hypothetical protein